MRQGRDKAILIQKETSLLELTRSVVFNPLRARMLGQSKHPKHSEELREVSKAQRRSLALSLHDSQEGARKRKEAMTQASLSGAYTMAEIGDHCGVHSMTVSRAVRAFERIKQKS